MWVYPTVLYKKVIVLSIMFRAHFIPIRYLFKSKHNAFNLCEVSNYLTWNLLIFIFKMVDSDEFEVIFCIWLMVENKALNKNLNI